MQRKTSTETIMITDPSKQPRNVRENHHKKMLLFCPQAEERDSITTFLTKRGFHNIYIQNAERDLSSWIDQYGINVVFLFDPARFGPTIDLARWLRHHHPDCVVTILPGRKEQLLKPHWKRVVLRSLYDSIPTELARP